MQDYATNVPVPLAKGLNRDAWRLVLRLAQSVVLLNDDVVDLQLLRTSLAGALGDAQTLAVEQSKALRGRPS